MLGGLLAHPLQTIDLPLDGLGHLLGELALGELGAIRGRDILVFAELLTDRIQLLAEDVVLLPLLDSLGRLVAHLAPQFQIGEHLAHPAEEETETLPDVDRLEKLDLLLQTQVG